MLFMYGWPNLIFDQAEIRKMNRGPEQLSR